MTINKYIFGSNERRKKKKFCTLISWEFSRFYNRRTKKSFLSPISSKLFFLILDTFFFFGFIGRRCWCGVYCSLSVRLSRNWTLKKKFMTNLEANCIKIASIISSYKKVFGMIHNFISLPWFPKTSNSKFTVKNIIFKITS